MYADETFEQTHALKVGREAASGAAIASLLPSPHSLASPNVSGGKPTATAAAEVSPNA